MNLTAFSMNKVVDAIRRGQSLSAPATTHYGLLTSTRGPRANTTAYALNDTMVFDAADGVVHLYKCTTAGTSAASAPAYAGANNEVVADGTATFTEQYNGLRDGTSVVEVAGGGYARVAVTSSLSNFSGTQGAGTTAASTGTSGETSNNVTITWPAPTGANWGYIWAFSCHSASTAGDMWDWAPLDVPKTVNAGDAAPYLPAGTAKLIVG